MNKEGRGGMEGENGRSGVRTTLEGVYIMRQGTGDEDWQDEDGHTRDDTFLSDLGRQIPDRSRASRNLFT